VVLIEPLGPRIMGLGIFVLFYLDFVLVALFPFPVSTAQFIGKFARNKGSESSMSDVAPKVLALGRGHS
jgi:hypothetical protein